MYYISLSLILLARQCRHWSLPTTPNTILHILFLASYFLITKTYFSFCGRPLYLFLCSCDSSFKICSFIILCSFGNCFSWVQFKYHFLTGLFTTWFLHIYLITILLFTSYLLYYHYLVYLLLCDLICFVSDTNQTLWYHYWNIVDAQEIVLKWEDEYIIINT